MSIYKKFSKEKEVAEYFIKEYLKSGDLKEGKDNEGIDGIIELSDTKLNLQIITCDKNTIQITAKSIKHAKEIFTINRNPIEDIIDCINKKNNHYPKELLSEMTLLVHSENISINKNFLIKKTKEVCSTSSFKSVYFILLPDSETKTTYPKNNGSIIKLK